MNAAGSGLARQIGRPVIPLSITAHNSIPFYPFDSIHSTLRDMTSFHNTLTSKNIAFPLPPDDRLAPLPFREKARKRLSLSYDFFRLLGHNGAAIRHLKMPDSGGGWIANSLVYKDR